MKLLATIALLCPLLSLAGPMKTLLEQREVTQLENRMTRQGFQLLQIKDERVKFGEVRTRSTTEVFEMVFLKETQRRSFRVEVSVSQRYSHVWISER
jgi:hypothetical protein